MDEQLHLGYRKGKTAGKSIARQYTRIEPITQIRSGAHATIATDGASFLSHLRVDLGHGGGQRVELAQVQAQQ